MILFFFLYRIQESKTVFDPEFCSSLFLSFYFGLLGISYSIFYFTREVISRNTPFYRYGILWAIAFVYASMWRFQITNLREIITYLSASFLCLLYFVNEKRLNKYYIICSIFCVGMAIYGFFQYVKWIPSINNLFSVTGTFDNPAGIGMFLAILFPYIFYLAKLKEQANYKQAILCLCAGIVGTVIIVSGSRTGMLAALVGLFCLYTGTWRKKYSILLTSLSIILFLALYFCKPLSANGRFFIALISCRIIGHQPLLSGDLYGFETKYMLEQAEYFRQFPNSIWISIADNIRVPFNEFLLFFIRFGIVGTLWLLGTIFYLYHLIRKNYSPQKKPAIASLCASLVCACFSYPSYYMAITLVIVITLVVLCTPLKSVQHQSSTFNWLGISILSVVLIGLCCFQYNYEQQRWQLETRSLNGEESEELDQAYEKSFRNWYFSDHPTFLYNYALHLYERKQFEKTLSILKLSRQYKQDYDWQMIYAYTLKQLSKSEQSIRAFQLASYMLPGRLQPLYEMMCLYDDMGKYSKALLCAQKALSLPSKVHNFKTDYLRVEIKNYILNLNKREEVLPMETKH